jgi:urease alpha subunit
VGIRVALVLGLGTSLAAVAGMMIIVGLIDGHSILPASKSDWQEAFEYVVTITLATAAGSLVARAAYSAAPGRYGIF